MSIVRIGRGPYATSLHVEREGRGEPLLWITGFAISSEIFSPVIATHTTQFDCIRYDNRGAGRSATPRHVTSIPELAGDAVRLLDALGVDSAPVYGLSMGGMVAQEMAIRFPDRVRALVLGATSHGGPRGVLPSPRIAAALTGRGAPAAVRDRTNEQVERAGITRPTYALQLLPGYDRKPGICELVHSQFTNLTIKGAWTGPVRLQLFEHALAPLADLPVRRSCRRRTSCATSRSGAPPSCTTTGTRTRVTKTAHE